MFVYSFANVSLLAFNVMYLKLKCSALSLSTFHRIICDMIFLVGLTLLKICRSRRWWDLSELKHSCRAKILAGQYLQQTHENVHRQDMFNSVQSQGCFMNFSLLITTCQPYLHSLHVSKRNLVPRIPTCVDWIKNFLQLRISGSRRILLGS